VPRCFGISPQNFKENPDVMHQKSDSKRGMNMPKIDRNQLGKREVLGEEERNPSPLRGEGWAERVLPNAISYPSADENTRRRGRHFEGGKSWNGHGRKGLD